MAHERGLQRPRAKPGRLAQGTTPRPSDGIRSHSHLRRSGWYGDCHGDRSDGTENRNDFNASRQTAGDSLDIAKRWRTCKARDTPPAPSHHQVTS